MEKTKSVPFNGTQEQEAMLHAVIDELREDKGCLMPIMQKAQEIYGYLPYEVQKMISDELDVPMEKIYGVSNLLLPVQFISERTVQNFCMSRNSLLRKRLR